MTSWVSLLAGSSLESLTFPTLGDQNRLEKVAATSSISSRPLTFFPLNSRDTLKQNTSVQAKTGLSVFAAKTSQAWRQAITWRDTVRTSSCVPKFTTDRTLPTIIPTAYHQPATLPTWSEATTTQPVPQPIRQVFQHLVGTTEPAEAYAPSSSSTFVRVSTPHPKTPQSDLVTFRFWHSPQQLRQEISDKGFQVWVNGHLVAQVPKRKQAKHLMQQLRRVLDHQTINPDAIKPALREGTLAGVVGDQVLFTIDEQLWKDHRDDLQLLVIKWVNNLRVALNASSLNLVEAQQEMFQLVKTEQTIGGLASWYGPYFHGRLTANGEIYDQYALTAAHPSLPLGTFLQVTNLENQNSIVVRVNDRGPYIPPRSLDLSLGAARCLGSEDAGVVRYKAVVLQQS